MSLLPGVLSLYQSQPLGAHRWCWCDGRTGTRVWLEVCSRGRRKELSEVETAPGPLTAPVSRYLQKLLSGQAVSHSIFINLTKQQPHQGEEHLSKSSAGGNQHLELWLNSWTRGCVEEGHSEDEEGAEMGAGGWVGGGAGRTWTVKSQPLWSPWNFPTLSSWSDNILL